MILRFSRNAIWLLLFGLAPRPGVAQKMAAPRSFEAVALSPSDIRCYWLPHAEDFSYLLMRDGRTIATLPASTTEFIDSGLTPGSTHHYTISTSGQGAESEASGDTERTFTLLPKPTRDRRPQKLAFDVVVAQASSGGVAAAVEAARRGYRVALIEPSTRLGGMPVNGLSATDLRRPEHASGFLTRFRDKVRALYAAEGVQASGLQYEPLVAHKAMKAILFQYPGITLFRRTRLTNVHTRPVGFLGNRKRVETVTVEELNARGEPDGRRAELGASIFIDATDCGDLAAWAGAAYRLGREPRSRREPHNGVIYYDRKNDRLLPGSTGAGDRRIQAYTYLLTVKDYGPGADKTISKPPGYRREDFVHTPSWKESWAVTSGKMPNGKYELNQHPQGGDIQGINYHYPLDGYKERARLEQLYRNHVLSYLYYIQTEQGQKQIGLPDDEYRDSGGFPPLLYVREGRRVLGEQLPDEADISAAGSILRPESVGLGDYPMDSHAVRPKTDWTTPDMGEGEWWLYEHTPVHALPLGILVPRQLDNVFVTTAVSSTHVSFGTYRLEPVRMAFGQAAGIAADYCIRYHLAARDVPARQIQDELLPHAANPYGDGNNRLTYFSDVRATTRNYYAIEYMSARGFGTGSEELKPDASTTRGELARWLTLLAGRAAPPPITVHSEKFDRAYNSTNGVEVRQPFYAYMGPSADPVAVKSLIAFSHEKAKDPPATRAEIAHWLVRVLPSLREGAQSGHYSDLAEPALMADVEALYANYIRSILWDGAAAIQTDGTLHFRPDAPLSHADMLETLYLVQIGLGPLFNDAPWDSVNGRSTPSALFENVWVDKTTPR